MSDFSGGLNFFLGGNHLYSRRQKCVIVSLRASGMPWILTNGV